MKKWKSIIVWDCCLGFKDNTTTDTHETKEIAEWACNMLKQYGFGGERRHFPVSTRVEPIEPIPPKGE